jgi:hypothetical protein
MLRFGDSKHGTQGPRCLRENDHHNILGRKKAQGLKPGFLLGLYGPTEVVP